MFLKTSDRANVNGTVVRNILVAVASVLCLAGIASCGGGKDSAAKAPAGIERKVERGPITAVVRVDKGEVTIADRVNLSIEVRAKEDYEVELPPVGDKLEQFGIVDYRTDQPQLVGTNEVVTRRSYVLEPFLSGDYTIRPFKVTFRKKTEAADVRHELETAEVTVKVTSLLPETIKELQIKDIVPPVRLPGIWNSTLLIAVVLGVILLLMAVVITVFLMRRGRGIAAAQVVPAHELAYRRLQELVDEDLIGKGEIKLFYQRISDILRHYIEDRFGLRAPEQTTEEFLGTLGASDALVVQYRNLLKSFLLNCDMVKFAEHHPDSVEIQNAFNSCRTFITETVPRDVNGAPCEKPEQLTTDN